MVKQPFERKSLWHLSAPCYHAHISMGDNFETACSMLRTYVPAEACKDESLLLPSKPLCPTVSFKDTHCSCIGCPGSNGCQWPSLYERKQLGRKAIRVLAGERFHLVNQDLEPEPVLTCWSYLPHCSLQDIPRLEEQLKGSVGQPLTGFNFKHVMAPLHFKS